MNYRQFILENVIESNVSYRGGTVKVDVSKLFPYLSNPVMGAYQNYLGGGIAGKITGGAMFHPSELKKKDWDKFWELNEEIKKYFFEINNGGGDEYMQSLDKDYEDNQCLPKSAY